MRKVVLADTCFWIGLIDPSDQFHNNSKTIAEFIEDCTILFPWPCLYETISTHLIRMRNRLLFLEEIITKPNIILLEDDNYKDEALKQVFQTNKFYGFSYSLTDSVIREILNDQNIKINYLVTFNEKDFKDICDHRAIEIISE